jgi:hypothetical protein
LKWVGLEDWEDKIPSKYKSLILDIFSSDPEFACFAVASNLTSEDAKLTDIEKDFLNNPGMYDNALQKYYLDELVENGYDELRREILKIPDLKNDIDTLVFCCNFAAP